MGSFKVKKIKEIKEIDDFLLLVLMIMDFLLFFWFFLLILGDGYRVLIWILFINNEYNEGLDLER